MDKRLSFWIMKIAVFVSDNPGSSINEVSNSLNISYKAAQRYLRKLRELGILIVRVQGRESIHRYYPNPDAEEFFKLARFLIESLEKIIILKV